MVETETMDPPSQVDMNYEAFQKLLPDLIPSHIGKLAVMHDGEIVAFFDSFGDAVRYGMSKFEGFGNFSVQQVTNEAASLGFYSYASRDLQ